MSDAPTATTTDTDPEPDHIKQLREDAAEGAKARRRLAIIEAGFDIKSGPVKLFAEHYKGELTEEAVLAAAAEFDLKPAGAATTATTEEAPPPPPSKGPTLTPEEVAHFAQRGETAAGAGGEQTDAGDPWDAGLREQQAVLATGATRREANIAAFSKVFEAAANGDQRVLYNHERWFEDNGGVPGE